MASNINPNIINITYPVAGQDNDTQGFRDNFSNIKNNFSAAATEISALQASLGSALQSTTVPVSASAPGTTGQIAFSSTYLYVCVATNTWVRASLATWP
jgi:hypothetical protein